MDVAFEGAHMIWDGVLCCTADDPEAYYAADARRVLELFVLAAEQGLELEADTLLAAAGAAPGVRSLSGRAAGAAAQRLLLSGAPEALGVLCAAGAYASFGLPQRAPCLHGLAEAPAVPMARWWLYLRRCGTSAVRDASLCAALELDAALPELMAALDVLAAKVPGSVWYDTFDEVVDHVMKNARPGDLVITLGCGDIYKAAKKMVAWEA